MKISVVVFLTLICLGTASCSQQEAIDRFAPKTETVLAKASLDELRNGHVDALLARVDPKLQTSSLGAKLKDLRTYFPPGDPRSIKTVGAYTQYENGIKRVNLTFEYQFDTAWVLGGVGLLQDGDKEWIEGIHVERMTQSIEQVNAFTFNGKGPAHWLMAGLACVIPLICLYAFVLCLRTPIKRLKWLWAIFTLIGIVTLRLNWTTGAFSLQSISFQLFGASAMSPLFGAWKIGISFPLGAVLFLMRRRELMRQAAAALPPNLPDVAPTELGS